MTRSLGAVLWLLATGCVEFTDPVGLGLGRNTIINVSFDLREGSPSCGDSIHAPHPVRMAGLCVQALFQPGVDRFGAPRQVVDDTLWAMGVPVLPVVAEDSSRFYAHGFVLPLDRLADTVFTARFPRVAGQAVPVEELRWTAIEPRGPDTLYRAPGEGVRLAIELPLSSDDPQPTFRFWQASLSGGTSAVYNGFGVPLRSAYDFPAAVADSLGGSVAHGSVRWRRQYSPVTPLPNFQLAITFEQILRWVVLPKEPGG